MITLTYRGKKIPGWFILATIALQIALAILWGYMD